MIAVQLVTEAAGKIVTEKVGEFPTKRKAFAAAQKAAGQGSEFVTRGIAYGYSGPRGMAWIVE